MSGDADVDARLRRLFLETFKLTTEELERLGLFLLAHALLDRYLIHLLAIMEATREMPRSPTADIEAPIDALIAEYSNGAFGLHLNMVRDKGLLGPWYWEVCEELNRGRNYFLHWKPGRFSRPKYKGVDVTTADGLAQCLREVFEVIAAIFGGEDDEVTPLDRLR